MLQSIRDNITGWIAWVVVILLSIPFALFGINTYFEGQFSNAVATVNGEEIGNQAFRSRYQEQYQRIRQMFGDQFDPEMIDEERMRRQVLNQMIEEELLVQQTNDQRYRVSEEQVINEIRSYDVFQVDGQFDMDRYRGLLRSQGMTPSQLERRVEREMQGRLIQQALQRSSFATEQELERMASLQSQQREFSEVRIAVEDFMDAVTVTDEEVAAFYDDNADRFMTEEKVDLAYIELALADVADAIEISEEELRQAWEAEQESYVSDEERHARHILITAEDGNEEAARAELEQLAERIREGESFEAIAREHSDDPVSAEDGGSLGWVLPGDMVDAVDTAIFSLEEGELSDIVESDFGFHLIRVDDIESPEPLPFEEAREELLAEMKRSKAEQRYYELRETLADESFANPDELSYIAGLLDLEIQNVSGVTRDQGEDIASHSRVRSEAFSEMVLNERLNSDPIELDDERVVVIRVVEHHPAERRPLDTVADDIRERLTRDKAVAEAEARAQGLMEAIREGAELETVAGEAGLSVDGPKRLARSDSTVDNRLRQRVFRMPRPEDGARVELIHRDDGDLSLVMLHSVEDGSLEALAQQERAQRRQSIRQQIARAEFDAYVSQLRHTADVQVMVDTDDEEEIFGRQ